MRMILIAVASLVATAGLLLSKPVASDARADHWKAKGFNARMFATHGDCVCKLRCRQGGLHPDGFNGANCSRQCEMKYNGCRKGQAHS